MIQMAPVMLKALGYIASHRVVNMDLGMYLPDLTSVGGQFEVRCLSGAKVELKQLALGCALRGMATLFEGDLPPLLAAKHRCRNILSLERTPSGRKFYSRNIFCILLEMAGFIEQFVVLNAVMLQLPAVVDSACTFNWPLPYIFPALRPGFALP